MFTLISPIIKRGSGLKNIPSFSFHSGFFIYFSWQEGNFLVFLLAVVYGFCLGMEAGPQ